MTYREAEGDLFEMGLPAIGHGVNCAGVMGAGIAVEFKHRWPVMFRTYRMLCRRDMLKLGSVLPWFTTGNPGEPILICNLATHALKCDPDHPGGTSIGAIDTSVRRALRVCDTWGIDTLGLPRIGCGIGGLRWSDVQDTLQAAAENSPVELVVVTLPEVSHAGRERRREAVPASA